MRILLLIIMAMALLVVIIRFSRPYLEKHSVLFRRFSDPLQADTQQPLPWIQSIEGRLLLALMLLFLVLLMAQRLFLDTSSPPPEYYHPAQLIEGEILEGKLTSSQPPPAYSGNDQQKAFPSPE
ncbi:hypothetical protein ACQZV8_13120 [Magnetococcales bacterium HHB-1]